MVNVVFVGSCSADAMAEARAALRDLCNGGLFPIPMCETLELIVTELVTNALTAGSSALEVLLDSQDGSFEVRVRDDAPGIPVQRVHGRYSTGGRGLEIIETLAEIWGYRPVAGGKEVWARVIAPA